MTLRELLEELRENILHDRSDQIAGASDYLWSDRTLVRYIDQAQRRMARQALILRDYISYFPTKPFEKAYKLPPYVIAVISARCLALPSVSPPLPEDHSDLARAGHALFDTYHVPDTYFFDPGSLSALPPGKMLAFDTDEYLQEDDEGSLGTMTLRVFPAPDPLHIQPLRLRVLRLPKTHLTLENLDVSPEIPEEHHLDLLDWAAYLALRIVDVDEGMPSRAQEFMQTFEVHCLEARKIMMRKLFAVSAWGFGRNGFSWDTDYL
jgi:hypothetical protein